MLLWKTQCCLIVFIGTNADCATLQWCDKHSGLGIARQLCLACEEQVCKALRVAACWSLRQLRARVCVYIHAYIHTNVHMCIRTYRTYTHACIH